MTEPTTSAPPTCLWCASPLPEPVERTTRCPSCGRHNRREDLATLRTLRPRARRLQTILEVASALVLAICVLRSAIHWRHLKGGDPDVALSILAPAGLAILVGYQSRYITRRRRGPLMHVSATGCGIVAILAAAYLAFLGLTQRDLDGLELALLLTGAGGIAAIMATRVWRAARSESR